MSKVILHPACSHSPAAVRAVEQATGLVAVRMLRGPRVIQLVPPTSSKGVA